MSYNIYIYSIVYAREDYKTVLSVGSILKLLLFAVCIIIITGWAVRDIVSVVCSHVYVPLIFCGSAVLCK